MSYTVDFITAVKALHDGKADKISRKCLGEEIWGGETVYIRPTVGGFYKYVGNEDREERINIFDSQGNWEVHYKPEHRIYPVLMIFKGDDKVYMDKELSLPEAMGMWESHNLKAIYSVDPKTQQMTKLYEPSKGGES